LKKSSAAVRSDSRCCGYFELFAVASIILPMRDLPQANRPPLVRDNERRIIHRQTGAAHF
jgi:hypothetical protein